MAINYTPKAHVKNSASLPTTGNAVGDVRITLNDGKQYYWNGSSWVILESFKQRNIPGNINGPFTLADHIADNDPHDQYLLRSDFNDLVLSGDLGQILSQHIDDPDAHGSNYLKPDVVIHELINTSDKVPDVGLLYRVNTSMQNISSTVSANNSYALASIASATNLISVVSTSAHNDSVALNSSIRDLSALHSQEVSNLSRLISNMSAAEIGNLAEVASSGSINANIANNRIDSLISTVNANTSAIGTINTKINAIPNSVTNIASTLDSALSSNIDVRLTQLSSADNALNSSFIHVSTNVNNASSKLNSMISSASGALSNSISSVNNNYVEHIDATDWVVADNDPGITPSDPEYISVTAVTDLEERTDAVGTYVYVDEASAWYINQYNNPHPQYVLVTRVVSSVDLGSYDTNLIPTVSVVSEVNQRIIDHINATTNIHPQYSLTNHDHNGVYAYFDHVHDQYLTISQLSVDGLAETIPNIQGTLNSDYHEVETYSELSNITDAELNQYVYVIATDTWYQVTNIDNTHNDWVVTDDPGISSDDPSYIEVASVSDLASRTDPLGTYVYVTGESAWYEFRNIPVYTWTSVADPGIRKYDTFDVNKAITYQNLYINNIQTIDHLPVAEPGLLEVRVVADYSIVNSSVNTVASNTERDNLFYNGEVDVYNYATDVWYHGTSDGSTITWTTISDTTGLVAYYNSVPISSNKLVRQYYISDSGHMYMRTGTAGYDVVNIPNDPSNLTLGSTTVSTEVVNWNTWTEISNSVASSAQTAITTHAGNTSMHVSSTDRTSWDGVVTNFGTHSTNTTIHVTSADKLSWDNTVTNFGTHSTNTTIHVTANDKTAWDGAVTNLGTHTSNNDIHVTTSDKQSWNGAVSTLGTHTSATDIHVTTSDKQSWNGVVTNFGTHSTNNDIHVTSTDKSTWSSKADISDINGRTLMSSLDWYDGKGPSETGFVASLDDMTATGIYSVNSSNNTNMPTDVTSGILVVTSSNQILYAIAGTNTGKMYTRSGNTGTWIIEDAAGAVATHADSIGVHIPVTIALSSSSITPEHNAIYTKTLASSETFSFTTPTNGKCVAFRLYLSTGSTVYAPTWPSDIVWDDNNTPPTFTETNALYMFVFEWNPILNKWLGNQMWDPISI